MSILKIKDSNNQFVGIPTVKGEDGTDGVSPLVTISKSGKVTTITITDAQGIHTATINDGEDGQGVGDMLKSIYDSNDDGIVDNAEKVNNHTVNKDVPSDADFSDENAIWGNITGSLANQTDLQNALNGKGTYSKPSNGIPKTDLDSSVQSSLEKADSALQSHQDISGKFDKTSVKTLKTTSNNDTYSCNYINSLFNMIYPVGTIIIKDDSTDYSSWLGFTWQKVFAGKVLVGQDTNDTDFDTIGETGGEKTHTLTVNEMPSHNHGTTHFAVSQAAPGYSAWEASVGGDTTSLYLASAVTNNKGGGEEHNNLQPYQVVAYWKRTV